MGAVFNRSAIVVGSPVGYLVQKLLEEVYKTALNLDTVEACISCDLCGVSEVPYGLPDILDSFRAAGFHS